MINNIRYYTDKLIEELGGDPKDSVDSIIELLQSKAAGEIQALTNMFEEFIRWNQNILFFMYISYSSELHCLSNLLLTKILLMILCFLMNLSTLSKVRILSSDWLTQIIITSDWFLAGNYNKVPMIIGTNQNEGLLIKAFYQTNLSKYDEAWNNWVIYIVFTIKNFFYPHL